MRIILIRHGQSLGNVDDAAYARLGDPVIPLTDTGWVQARDAGVFLRDWLNDPARGNRPGRWPHIWPVKSDPQSPPRPADWPHIWCSPFTRTRETLSGILHGMGDDALVGARTVRQDSRLSEQSFGALAYINAQSGFLRRAFARAVVGLSDQIYKHSPYLSYTPFGESPMAVMMRADSVVASLHRYREKHGMHDVMIVSHGGFIKSFMMRWFHMPISAWQDIETAGNCDVFVIEKPDPEKIYGTPGAGWAITRIYDGQAGMAAHDNPLARARLFVETQLPDVPAHLKNGPR